jgi:hypothetical protein
MDFEEEATLVAVAFLPKSVAWGFPLVFWWRKFGKGFNRFNRFNLKSKIELPV